MIENLKLTELLISRLCHELVGATGGLSNGVEYLNETKEEKIDEDVLKLLLLSSEQLSVRLKFYRIAYGFAGNKLDNLAELRGLAIDFFGPEEGVELEWPMAPVAPDIHEGEGRVVLNMLVVAKSCLPGGGLIYVDMDENGITMELSGDSINLPENFEKSIRDEINLADLDAKNIHDFYTHILVKNANFGFSHQMEDDTGNENKQARFMLKREL